MPVVASGSVFASVVRPYTRGDLLASGVSVAKLRGPSWQRTSQGFYVPVGVDLDLDVQRIAAASVRLPAEGALGGWAAARALGVVLCDGLAADGRMPLDVPLVTGGQEQRPVRGIEVWRDPLPPDDVRLVDGVQVTSPARTCFDGMRRAGDIAEAVAFADLLLHAGLVTVPQMRDYVATRPGWRGARRARRALELADPMSRNAWETRLRMVWVLEARLPRPLCNPPLFDLAGNLLGYPDLLDPEGGTVGEYDGGGHREADRHHHDNVREELFEDHGLVVTRATSIDLRNRSALAARMRRARARGMRHDRRSDRWMLEPPPEWGSLCAESSLHRMLDEMDAAWTPPW